MVLNHTTGNNDQISKNVINFCFIHYFNENEINQNLLIENLIFYNDKIIPILSSILIIFPKKF